MLEDAPSPHKGDLAARRGGCAHPLWRENPCRGTPLGTVRGCLGSGPQSQLSTLQEPLHTECQAAHTHVHSAVLITTAGTGPPRVRRKQTNRCARGLA